MTEPEEPDRLSPTKVTGLAVIAVVSAIVGFVAVRSLYSSMPPLPILTGLSFYVFAVFDAGYAVWVRYRLRHNQIGHAPGELHPITAARLLALAKASSILGSALSGLAVGAVVFLAINRTRLLAAQHDFPSAIVALVGAVLLTAAGLLLEFCLRTPDDPQDQSPA